MLSQEKAVEAYHNGKVLYNSSRGQKDVIVFKLFGKMFVTNNVKRNNKYSFDDCCWEVKRFGIIHKVKYMWATKLLNDCKKSLKAGV